MSNLIGKITAELVEKDSIIPDHLVEKINVNIRPLEPVNRDDVHIRAMYVVSDQVNSFGGIFPADEHQKLIEHLIDSPVLVGHRKDSLPIARNFHAEQVALNDANWVKVYFYWLKNSKAGEELKNNIDAGIYKECSISFIFSFPECTICGSDIRDCRHRPFHNYETPSGEKKEAYFNYRRIDKVLETSLVYRGSVNNTSITKELAFQKADDNSSLSVKQPPAIPAVNRIWNFDAIDQQARYLVMPAYEALPVILEKSGDVIQLRRQDGAPIQSNNINRMLGTLRLPQINFACDCRLIGYRGKERQKISELGKFVCGEQSSVSRAELKMYDLINLDGVDVLSLNALGRREKLEELFGAGKGMLPPVELISGDKLHQALKKVGTRYGVEILADDSTERYLFTKRKLAPAIIRSREECGGRFKYNLAVCIDGKELPAASALMSPLDLSVGEKIDIEATSVHETGDTIELLDPIISDWYGQYGCRHTLSSLHRPHGKKLLGNYSLFPISQEEFHLALDYGDGANAEHYAIRHYSPRLLDSGRMFLMEKSEITGQISSNVQGTGRIISFTNNDGTLVIDLDGFLCGKFAIRPARLNGKMARVFCKVGNI